MQVLRMVVRPQHAERVCQTLNAHEDVIEVLASEVLGAGIQRGGRGSTFDSLPRVLIECWTEATHSVVPIVIAECRTGRIGDGKIMCVDVIGEA